MNNLREYATTAAYNADSTREYPTVSYIDNVGIKYEEKPPVLTLIQRSGHVCVGVTYDPDVITKWPNIEIDNSNMSGHHFVLQNNTFVDGNSYQHYTLSKDGSYIRSSYDNDANGTSEYEVFDYDGTVISSGI